MLYSARGTAPAAPPARSGSERGHPVTRLVMAWLLAGGVVAASAAAADAPAVKRQRSAVALKYGDAKALAETLGKHFKGDGDVSVLAEPATNTLLISAPEKAHADVVALVKVLDRRPKTVAIEVLI